MEQNNKFILSQKTSYVRYPIMFCVLFIGYWYVFSSFVRAEAVSNFSNGNGGTWDAGYYRAVSITNSTGITLTNYQVKLVLTTAILGNPYSNIKPDGSDIRFVLSDKAAELSYWIESFNNIGISHIWIKIPSLSSGNSVIYMHYGNPLAVSASNGDATFEFFDDFEGPSGKEINNKKWAWTGEHKPVFDTTHARSGKTGMKLTGSSDCGGDPYHVLTIVDAESDYVITNMKGIFTAWIYDDGNGCESMAGFDYTAAIGIYGNGNYRFRITEDASYPPTNITRSQGWHKLTMIANGKDTLFYIDDIYVATKPDVGTFNRVFAGNSHSGEVVDYFDDVYVRKYASPEPMVSVSVIKEVMSNYILLSNPANLITSPAGIKRDTVIPLLKFNLELVNKSDNSQKLVHWKRLRIDKYVPAFYFKDAVPVDKVEILIMVDNNKNGQYDVDDVLISKGTIKNGDIWLNMNRYEITAMPQTFYVAYKIAGDAVTGQRVGVEIKNPDYLEFEETNINVSSQNF
jgi:hypothetical protein